MNGKDYEVFFHLALSSDENFDISVLKMNKYFLIASNNNIGDTHPKTNRKFKRASLDITALGNGEETLASLNSFILNLNELNKLIKKADDKCLYISLNYWAQCNFELDSRLLGILSKYNIALAISAYKQ